MSLLRFFQTVRSLKYSQLYHRLLHNRKMSAQRKNPDKIYTKFLHAGKKLIDDHTISAIKEIAGNKKEEWLIRDNRKHGMFSPPDIEDYTFSFLNQKTELEMTHIWQRHENMPLLWDFNLHYFEYILSIEKKKALSFVNDWIKQVKPDNPIGFHPYTVSLRLRNWAKFFIDHPDLLDKGIIESISLQTAYLEKNRERHLLANHLLENEITFVFMGLFLGNIDLISRHEPLLFKELKEQTNKAGGHYEGSFMYHLLLLEALTDLYKMYKIAGRASLSLESSIKKWGGYLSRTVSKNGVFPLFGDSAIGISADPLKLHAYVRKLVDIPDIHGENRIIEAQGLVVLEQDDIYMAMNAQNPAPSYNPGHRHSDLLTFELYYKSKPIVVDSGVFGYAETGQRLMERRTSAHNTITADGLDIHDIWGSFRMGRRSTASAPEINTIKNSFKAGYKNKHINVTREIKLTGNKLEINDSIQGMKKGFETRFHFPSEFHLRKEKQGLFILTGSHLNIHLSLDPNLKTITEPFPYSREFGKKETGMCLIIKGTSASQKYTINIKE